MFAFHEYDKNRASKEGDPGQDINLIITAGPMDYTEMGRLKIVLLFGSRASKPL
jgi:hypothetical protein